MLTRVASIDDAQGMSQVLRQITQQTQRHRPHDPAFVISNYVANPTSIRCTVAIGEAGVVLGFQSLIRATAGNQYDVPEGWGIIGTHVSPRAHRLGVGTALFSSSKEAAEQAGVTKIDAYIGADNSSALLYYEALGFRTYREASGIVQKAYEVRHIHSAGV